MTSSPDDDALSWAADSDPTLSASGVPVDAPLPDGWSVPGRTPTRRGRAAKTTSGQGVSGEENTEVEPTPSGSTSIALLGTGILAGIYLLYTIGWFIGVARVGNPLVDPVGRAMFSVGGWLAVAAPIVWFATTYGLTSARPRMRFSVLLVGAIVLAPLPLIIGVGGVS